MKFDMHCHTAEGSPDAVVPIVEVIDRLKSKGYHGMVVTDHNSYKGYNSLKDKIEDFVVIKGIEYDTMEGAHMLIILPSNVDNEIFTLRGMRLEDTIKIVHVLGGIIGPAHPFDYYKMGMGNNPLWIKQFEIYNQLDFIEAFNACGREIGNILANKLADYLDKPKFGGSDSHRVRSIGKGYTIFKEEIKNADDLIRVIKEGNSSTTEVGGNIDYNAMINKHKILFRIGAMCYSIVNTYLSKKYEKRNMQFQEVLE